MAKCSYCHTDCFAYNLVGDCRVLHDTDFGDKPECPFYATRAQAKESQRKSEARLVKLGLSDRLNYENYKRKLREGRA